MWVCRWVSREGRLERAIWSNGGEDDAWGIGGGDMRGGLDGVEYLSAHTRNRQDYQPATLTPCSPPSLGLLQHPLSLTYLNTKRL